jgi:hypothetical protein
VRLCLARPAVMRQCSRARAAPPTNNPLSSAL